MIIWRFWGGRGKGNTDIRRRSGGLLAGNITSGKIAENRAVQAANSPVVYKIKVKPTKDYFYEEKNSAGKATLQVCIDSEKQPRIYQLTPRQGRIKLDEVQDAPVAMYPASVCTVNFDTGRWGLFGYLL